MRPQCPPAPAELCHTAKFGGSLLEAEQLLPVLSGCPRGTQLLPMLLGHFWAGNERSSPRQDLAGTMAWPYHRPNPRAEQETGLPDEKHLLRDLRTSPSTTLSSSGCHLSLPSPRPTIVVTPIIICQVAICQPRHARPTCACAARARGPSRVS